MRKLFATALVLAVAAGCAQNTGMIDKKMLKGAAQAHIGHVVVGWKVDHVIPRMLGGRTSWENVVCSCVDCNRRKGGRTPQQARIRLKRVPSKPRWTPMMNHISSTVRYNEWRPFLSIVDASHRS